MIPFVDLKTQYQRIKPEIHAAIEQALEQAHFVLGPEVEAFERQFAQYTHTKHAIAVNSGTSALHLALLAIGVEAGDEVITTPFTFVATASAIDYTGAKPVFVDIEPLTYTIDPNLIEAAITPRTKAIIPVHIFGQPANMDEIMQIARRHNLRVIEDAAQAHGAEYRGQRIGGIGDVGCFSFYPGKNLGAYGEGGAVTTNDPEIARRIRMLRDWGAEQKYHHVLKGYNYRMDGVQGAVLGVKMNYIEGWTEQRRQHAARYNALLGDSFVVPQEASDRRHVYHVYAIRHPQRDQLQRFLAERDIQTGIHYPIPVHLQSCFSGLGYKAGDFPLAEQVANEVLSLPLFPEMTVEQQDQVVAALMEWHSLEQNALPEKSLAY
jgi:Predicted pyridoxal phosphate-dependent enzyme apparently involved in regulation of cell wall biogenesis